MAIGRRIHTFRQLSPAARRIAVASVPAYVWIGASLRLFGLARTARRTVKPRRRWRGKGAVSGDAGLIGEVIRRMGGVLPWHPRCLERSLVLNHLLRRRGHDARLRIGVRKRQPGSLPTDAGIDSAIEAHAWVEVDGRVVGDRPGVGAEFEVFEDLDAAWSASR